MEHSVKNSVIVAVGVVALLLETVVCGCTGFCVSQGETVLVGNNEDWRNRKTKLWYEPASEGTHGRVFFGFDNFYPQGGMNEKGLCFDGFATAPKKVTKSRHKPDFKGDNLLDAIMSQCATVEEVLREFDKYNLESMSRAMLFFADATGDAAIIEGDEVIRKEGSYQVVTNFYQSEVKREDVLCRRYNAADRMLAATDDVTIELCKQILDATHQEGRNPTVYSNIYDAKMRLVYLYHLHDFENVVVIDLAEELKKGRRRMDLPALFAKTAAGGPENDR
jgi:penicillin V acylase-like amidase (Ntn superfamily)